MANFKEFCAQKWKWIVAIALSTMMLMIAPIGFSMAHASDDSNGSVYVGSKVGYSGGGFHPIYSTTPNDPNNPGDPDYWAYCIEHDISAETGVTASTDGLSSFLGDNYFSNDDAVQQKVLWIITNSYPSLPLSSLGDKIGISDLSLNDATQATQFAIWRFTDLGFESNWGLTEGSDAAKLYDYLVNGAENNYSDVNLDDFGATVSVSAPTEVQTSSSLVGPFTVQTNQSSVRLSVDSGLTLTDASGTPIDANNVADGQSVYLDLRDVKTAGTATITASAIGASTSGQIISVPKSDNSPATKDEHAQSLILVSANSQKASDEATVSWKAPETVSPVIGTTLVDSADSDHVLAWNGGTAIDSVAYQNLVPGKQYTVAGELMDKADGKSTGITGKATFTAAEASGSVDVSFDVPSGYAGKSLVAFERLYEGTDTSAAPVATHEDIDSAAQTVTVEKAPSAAGSASLSPSAAASAAASSLPSASENASATTSDDELAETGLESQIPLYWAGFLAIAAGVVLVIARKAKRH